MPTSVVTHAEQTWRQWLWTVQGAGLAVITFLNFFPPAHGPTRYLFFSLLLIAVATRWKQGDSLWVRTPLDLPLLLLLGWILVSIPFSIDPAYSFREWRKLVAQALVFYWAMAVFRAQPDDRLVRHVMIAVLLGTLTSAGYAVVEFMLQGGTWRDRFIRAGAFGSDYNWLSTYMVMAIPLVLAVTATVRSRWMKGLSLGVAALALLAEFAAYTRAGWLGLAAEGLAGGWLSGRRWLVVGLILAFTAIGFGFVVASDMGFQRSTADPWTLEARVGVWKLAAADLLQHPLVGIGYGNNNFVKRYTGHPELEKAYGPHSTFVVMGLGSGVPALVLFAWLLIRIFLILTRAIGPMSAVASRAIPFGAAVMVVGFTVRNLFDYMFIGSLANLFWILVATALFCVRGQGSPERLPSIPQDSPTIVRA
jgi:heptosyltransferase-3/putative inorganic carbon (HCO3(-)) transporter